MKVLWNLFDKLRKRKPAQAAQVISLSGAVVIWTTGGNVVLTPELAKAVGERLPYASKDAEAIRHV